MEPVRQHLLEFILKIILPVSSMQLQEEALLQLAGALYGFAEALPAESTHSKRSV